MLEKQDIGTVESLRIDVLSETGWFDDTRFKADMAAGGGSEQSQYQIAWDAENAGGYSALLTLTLADGDVRRILLDTGWNTTWMDFVFAHHGVDAMLERGEIDAMVLSHWHLDHFWGIESAQARSEAQDLRTLHLAPGGQGTASGAGALLGGGWRRAAGVDLRQHRRARGRADPDARRGSGRQRPLPTASRRGTAHV